MRRSAVVGKLGEILTTESTVASWTGSLGGVGAREAIRGSRGDDEGIGELLRNCRRKWRLVDVLLSEEGANGG